MNALLESGTADNAAHDEGKQDARESSLPAFEMSATAGDLRLPATAPELPAFSSLDGLTDNFADGLNVSTPSLDELFDDDEENGPDWGALPEPLQFSKLESTSVPTEGDHVAPEYSLSLPTPGPVTDDPRIPKHLASYLSVGVHGGVILTPKAVLTCNSDDVKLEEAYEIFVRHGLNVPLKLSPAPQAADTASAKLDAQLSVQREALREEPLAPGAEIAHKAQEDARGSASATSDDPSHSNTELRKFSWMQSQTRKTVLEIGRIIQEDRAEREASAREGAEKARAAADAASRIARDDASGLPLRRDVKAAPHKQDVVRWVAQEEAAIAQALKAVRLSAQKRARRSGVGTGSSAIGGSGSEESSIWSFLMPRTTKMRPEAAAEMARAQFAAAAAVEVMREHQELNESREKRDSTASTSSRSSAASSASRRPRSAPPAPFHARGGDENARSGSDENSDGGRGVAQDGSSVSAIGRPFPDREEPLLTLDDSTFMARRRRVMPLSNEESLAALSLRTPGFPRALSMDGSRGSAPKPKPPPKKKRVSFTGTNTIHPI